MTGLCDFPVHNLPYLVLASQGVAAFSAVMDQEMCGQRTVLRCLRQVRPVRHGDQKAGMRVG